MFIQKHSEVDLKRHKMGRGKKWNHNRNVKQNWPAVTLTPNAQWPSGILKHTVPWMSQEEDAAYTLHSNPTKQVSISWCMAGTQLKPQGHSSNRYNHLQHGSIYVQVQCHERNTATIEKASINNAIRWSFQPQCHQWSSWYHLEMRTQGEVVILFREK